MLGKLMKYEFKATSRMLLPINGAMLLFALINRLFMELNFFQTGNMAISALATVMARLRGLHPHGARDGVFAGEVPDAQGAQRHGDHRRLCHYADRHYSAVL